MAEFMRSLLSRKVFVWAVVVLATLSNHLFDTHFDLQALLWASGIYSASNAVVAAKGTAPAKK